MKNGLFATRIVSIIAILAFALPAFADTITFNPATSRGPFHGYASYAVQFPGGYFFGRLELKRRSFPCDPILAGTARPDRHP
jgi:hypothetical protein